MCWILNFYIYIGTILPIQYSLPHFCVFADCRNCHLMTWWPDGCVRNKYALMQEGHNIRARDDVITSGKILLCKDANMMTHAQWPLFILQTKQRPSQLMYTRVLYKATPPPGHDSHLFILVPFTKLSYSCEVPFYSHWSIILSVISSFIFRSFLLCFARYTISSKGFTPYGDTWATGDR